MMRRFGLWFAAAVASILSIQADFGDLQFKLHEQRLPKPLLSDHTGTKVGSNNRYLEDVNVDYLTSTIELRGSEPTGLHLETNYALNNVHSLML